MMSQGPPGVPGSQLGYTNFGMNYLNIIPDYQSYLGNQAVAPGYINGNGTYNQWRLDEPGLFNQIGGVQYNQQYGSGGRGDPGNGANNDLTQWQQGDRLFNWPSANLEGQYSPIGNMFLRSDTSSGLGTTPLQNQWMAPLLLQAIREGRITPTARGQQFLQQVMGIAPQQYGNAGGGAIAGTTANPAGAGGAGGAGGSTQNALGSIAASQAADQAARLAYTSWQMRTGDEQLAMQKAQQAWTQTFQEQQARAQALGTFDGQDTLAKLNQEFSQRMQQSQLELSRAGLLGTLEGQKTLAALNQEYQQRVQAAGLTGQFDGQQTQQAQQQAWAQRNAEQQQQASNSLALLGLQAGMQGPRDYARYQQLSANTPGGLQQMLQGFAGQYGFAGSGYQGTPGPATLQSRTQDLLSGGQLGQGGQQQAAQPTAGATPAQNGYALPAPNQINLRNWQAASPSQQQMLLGGYEAAGYYGPDVERQIAASAPRYAGPSTAQVGF